MSSFSAQQTIAHLVVARRHGIATRRRRVPNARPPTLIESDYATRLVAVVNHVRHAARHVVSALPALLRADGELRLDDTKGKTARRAVDRTRAEVEHGFSETAFEGVAESFGKRVSLHQRGELVRQGRAALGIDISLIDPSIGRKIDAFVHENVALIKSLQGSALDDLEKIITRAVALGTRSDAVEGEIDDRFDIAARHARQIARDQIGKLNSQITVARHTELGLRSFDWQSVGDSKVRPRHRDLNGKRFTYDRPPPDGYPGMPICCRCLAKPVFDDLLEAADAVEERTDSAPSRRDANPNHDEHGRFASGPSGHAARVERAVGNRISNPSEAESAYTAQGRRLPPELAEAQRVRIFAEREAARVQEHAHIANEDRALAAGHIREAPMRKQAEHEATKERISTQVDEVRAHLDESHQHVTEALAELHAVDIAGNGHHPGWGHRLENLNSSELDDAFGSTSGNLHEIRGQGQRVEFEPQHLHAEQRFPERGDYGNDAAYHAAIASHEELFKSRATSAQIALEELRGRQVKAEKTLKDADREHSKAHRASISEIERLEEHDLVTPEAHRDPATLAAAQDASKSRIHAHYLARDEGGLGGFEDARAALHDEIGETSRAIRELSKITGRGRGSQAGQSP